MALNNQDWNETTLGLQNYPTQGAEKKCRISEIIAKKQMLTLQRMDSTVSRLVANLTPICREDGSDRPDSDPANDRSMPSYFVEQAGFIAQINGMLDIVNDLIDRIEL